MRNQFIYPTCLSADQQFLLIRTYIAYLSTLNLSWATTLTKTANVARAVLKSGTNLKRIRGNMRLL